METILKKSILSFFLFGAILSAAPVQVTYLDPGHPAEAANGVYVGPYDLNVNGQTVQAMCMDDFLHVSGSWNANLTAVNGTDFSNTYVGHVLGNDPHTFSIPGYGDITFGAKDVYQAEAYLFSEIIEPGADRANLQEAAWAIMDPNTLLNVFNTNNTNVKNILFDTYNHYSSFDASGYQIVSDVRGQEQEFMIDPTPASATPEPATIALMGGGLFAAGLARLFRRKKQTEVRN